MGLQVFLAEIKSLLFKQKNEEISLTSTYDVSTDSWKLDGLAV